MKKTHHPMFSKLSIWRDCTRQHRQMVFTTSDGSGQMSLCNQPISYLGGVKCHLLLKFQNSLAGRSSGISREFLNKTRRFQGYKK